jgi:hypothetical protein
VRDVVMIEVSFNLPLRCPLGIIRAILASVSDGVTCGAELLSSANNADVGYARAILSNITTQATLLGCVFSMVSN